MVAVSLFSVFIDKQSKLLWSLAISMVLSILVVQGLKHAIDAPRPPAVLAVDEIHVIIPAFRTLRPPDPAIDYAKLIDARPDTAAAWQNIQSDPNSPEARYWVPRMGGIATKEKFGIAYYQETLDLERGTYDGIYRPSARSFPSGHTATIVCALTLVMLHFRKRKWAWGLALAALAVGGFANCGGCALAAGCRRRWADRLGGCGLGNLDLVPHAHCIDPNGASCNRALTRAGRFDSPHP